MATTQKTVEQLETMLKTEHGYTPAMLEQLGLDCPDSGAYIKNLMNKLSELEADEQEDELLKEIE